MPRRANSCLDWLLCRPKPVRETQNYLKCTGDIVAMSPRKSCSALHDSAVQQADLPKPFPVDAVVQTEILPTFTVDAVVQTEVLPPTIDAAVQVEGLKIHLPRQQS